MAKNKYPGFIEVTKLNGNKVSLRTEEVRGIEKLKDGGEGTGNSIITTLNGVLHVKELKHTILQRCSSA